MKKSEGTKQDKGKDGMKNMFLSGQVTLEELNNSLKIAGSYLCRILISFLFCLNKMH